MKCKLWLGMMSAALMASLAVNISAAEKWELPNIGKMDIPSHVYFEEGQQAALPFVQDKGVKLYFVRRGASNGHYYTMTYANPPDFSYGWAASQKLGIPFLLEIGEISHKNDPLELQLDIIAGYLNKRISENGAVYAGESPLKKIDDKKYPRWEGSFITNVRESNIVYHEAYRVVLQSDGYDIFLGIINSDAAQVELTESLHDMMDQRKMLKPKKMLNLVR